MLENASVDWAMMIVLRRGPEETGHWITKRRNVLTDRATLGGHPRPVDGIAIMTDTDNTNSDATAYHGDTVVRAAAAPNGARDESSATGVIPRDVNAIIIQTS